MGDWIPVNRSTRATANRNNEIAVAEGITGFSLIAQEGSVADKLYRRLGYSPATWLHLERPGPRTDTAGPV